MNSTSQKVRGTESRPGDAVATIHLRPGDVVGVGHRDQQYPEFLWGASEKGHQGWVPARALEDFTPGDS